MAGIAFLLLSCLVGSTSAAQRAAAPPEKRLTLASVEQLLAVGVPDDVIAQEIADRGLVDDVTRDTITRLRGKGAGPRTLAAVSRLLSRVALVVQTTPGAMITFAGRGYGPVPDNGDLEIKDLEPGRYRLNIRKPDFRTIDTEVELRARTNAFVGLPLESAVGYLTVRVGIPGARVSIPGVGYRESFEGVKLAPGTYQVTITAPLRNTLTLPVEVVAGQTAVPEIKMSVDTAATGKLNTAVRTAYANRRYQQAIDSARTLEEMGWLDPAGSAAVAMSHWELRRYDSFVPAAKAALARNASLQFTLIHHHRVLVPEHPSTVTVSRQSIRFDPLGQCSTTAGGISLQGLRVEQRRVAGNNYVANQPALGIDFPNPKNPTKTESLNFVINNPQQLGALIDVIGHAASSR